MDEPTSFLGSLFDFSFSKFITTKIIKVLYVLAIIASGLGVCIFALTTIFGGFKTSFLAGVISLIVVAVVAPLGFLIYVCLARVWLELLIVIFRIAEHSKNIEELLKSGKDGAP